ncbi:MAG TPA: acyl-ACP thioesterase domain-containing protein [Atopostipes sp.]|nr:acyl-ACP thioesterase domain-containing protein [Atopostipes sp.]
MEPAVYERSLRIPHYLGDRYGRMTLPHLMNVLIEISGEQTTEINALPVRELGLSWVIIQYEFDIKRLPKTYETIRVKTFAKEYNRIFSYREFEVYDEEDNLIVDIMTVFALIDSDRKLSRISKEIVQGYGSTESRRIKRMPKPELPKNLEEAKQRNYQVGYFDIDTNFHANNSNYFMWMLEALGDEFLATHDPIYGNVVFEKEVHIGEEVESYADLSTNDENQTISRHQIKVGEVTKCTGTFTWVENQNTYVS